MRYIPCRPSAKVVAKSLSLSGVLYCHSGTLTQRGCSHCPHHQLRTGHTWQRQCSLPSLQGPPSDEVGHMLSLDELVRIVNVHVRMLQDSSVCVVDMVGALLCMYGTILTRLCGTLALLCAHPTFPR